MIIYKLQGIQGLQCATLKNRSLGSTHGIVNATWSTNNAPTIIFAIDHQKKFNTGVPTIMHMSTIVAKHITGFHGLRRHHSMHH